MKKFKKLKITGIILGSILVFFLLINVIPPKKAMATNPFISTSGLPMLCAHRGGGKSNPENTLKAYKASVEDYGTQIVESDLYMTKDGYLVYNHNAYINETSDVEERLGTTEKVYIEDLNLDELKDFNFGYKFQDKDGNYPYRNLEGLDNDSTRKDVLKANDIQIITAEELFKAFYETHKDLLFIVEIKNDGERGFQAADILADLLFNKYPDYKERVVIGTFHDDVQQYLKDNYSNPRLLTGASTGGAAGFVITQMLGVNLFNNPSFVCLQIPMAYDIKGVNIKLDKKTYIKRAHRRNIAVQYWTINEEEDMRHLIDLGCDAIMTDDPELLKTVLDSYK